MSFLAGKRACRGGQKIYSLGNTIAIFGMPQVLFRSPRFCNSGVTIFRTFRPRAKSSPYCAVTPSASCRWRFLFLSNLRAPTHVAK